MARLDTLGRVSLLFRPLPDHQVLAAVAWAATLRHGPVPNPWWRGDRAVPIAEVLAVLAPGHREAAGARLDILVSEHLLVRDADRLAVPPEVLAALGDAVGGGLGRSAVMLADAFYNAAEVHLIAEGLGLPASRNRDAARKAIGAALADPERVRWVLADAPQEAGALVDRLVANGPRVRSRCFTANSPYGHSRYTWREDGGAEHWLAVRGLLYPSGEAGVAELPYEVAEALRGDRFVPFTPVPPAVPDNLPLAARVEDEARARLGVLGGVVERLLAACAERPMGVRRSGGVGLRETKRLAAELGVDEAFARFCVDLCYAADLLGVAAEPEGTLWVLPTTAYDRWLSRGPAERLA